MAINLVNAVYQASSGPRYRSISNYKTWVWRSGANLRCGLFPRCKRRPDHRLARPRVNRKTVSITIQGCFRGIGCATRNHADRANRRLHFVGTSISFAVIILAIVSARPLLFIGALLVGYALPEWAI